MKTKVNKVSKEFDMEVCIYRAITSIRNHEKVKDYLRGDTIVVKENGELNILSKKEYHKFLLNRGYGLYLKGWVLFKKDSSLVEEMDNLMNKEMREIEKYNNGLLKTYIKDILDYPVLRGYVARVEFNFIKEENFIEGVSRYIEEDGAKELYLKIKRKIAI